MAELRVPRDDGGATQQAIENARGRFNADCNIFYVALPKNGGPAVARNVAWEKATQPYIAFLDADDAWHPKKLEIQMQWMLANPHAQISGHASRAISPNATATEQTVEWQVREIEPMQMLWSNPFATRGVIVRRALPLRFPENMRYAEDYFLWLSIAFSGRKAFVSPAILAFSFKADYGESGLTKKLWPIEKCELRVFRQLWHAGKIGWPTMLAAQIWSLARFVRRVVLLRLRA